MNYYTTTIDGKSYTFMASGDHLIIQDNSKPAGQPCKKVVKVEPDYEYTYN